LLLKRAEFPSLSWLAESQIEVFQGINDVVEDVLNDMRESGEQIPELFSVKKYNGNFQVRIVPDQHRALSIQAAEDGVSLNRLVSNKLACA
jgi:predicted HicB family RNase H-like nuclease